MVYKDISIFGEPSAVIVRGLLAANLQGKYEQLHTAVHDSKEKLDEKGLIKLAGSLGIDTKKLQADMNSDKIKQQFEGNMQLAQTLGVSATPTWMIGETVYQGGVPQEELKKIVATAKSGSSSTETTPTTQAQK
ncbi:DsbA family domain protein [Candidatus Bealeia paramacronuclearis]|uniref:DsbA family domain protein n=1 Tax=Candidatus Bealeia paramacronuclearis TaxID=1921001 RepID=A0ABZ2C416_9PROT|nr:DsbA family domain protein [Candidatus Bealeia paramacronuclearis]